MHAATTITKWKKFNQADCAQKYESCLEQSMHTIPSPHICLCTCRISIKTHIKIACLDPSPCDRCATIWQNFVLLPTALLPNPPHPHLLDAHITYLFCSYRDLYLPVRLACTTMLLDILLVATPVCCSVLQTILHIST